MAELALGVRHVADKILCYAPRRHMQSLIGFASCSHRLVAAKRIPSAFATDPRCLWRMTTSPLGEHAYFSSQARPSVIIFTSLPPLSGFTKIVSSASPRFRFSIAEAGVIRSLPCFVQPCALRFADNSAQVLFTFALLLNPSCSTSVL